MDHSTCTLLHGFILKAEIDKRLKRLAHNKQNTNRIKNNTQNIFHCRIQHFILKVKTSKYRHRAQECQRHEQQAGNNGYLRRH